MIDYERDGVHISETADGFDLNYQCCWVDVPADIHYSLLSNSTISGIYKYDGALYFMLKKNEIKPEYRLMKITTDAGGQLSIDTMGMSAETFDKIEDALIKADENAFIKTDADRYKNNCKRYQHKDGTPVPESRTSCRGCVFNEDPNLYDGGCLHPDGFLERKF